MKGQIDVLNSQRSVVLDRRQASGLIKLVLVQPSSLLRPPEEGCPDRLTSLVQSGLDAQLQKQLSDGSLNLHGTNAGSGVNVGTVQAELAPLGLDEKPKLLLVLRLAAPFIGDPGQAAFHLVDQSLNDLDDPLEYLLGVLIFEILVELQR